MPDDEWERFERADPDLAEFDHLEEEEATGIVHLDDLVPQRSARAFLLVLTGLSTGHMQQVGEGVTIGRSMKAGLRVPDEGASRMHARVFSRGGVTYLEDLGSSNGTRLNGELVDKAVPLSDGDKIQIGASCLIKFSFQDDLEEEFQRGMYEAARRDGLTKAFNKKALTDQLAAEFAYAHRHQAPLSLIMFDLDHFKGVNDTFGHPAGDYVLRTLAALVQTTIRTEDFLARYGGEEFAVLCRGITAGQTAVLAERLRARVEHHTFVFERAMIPVTISLGVASYPDPAVTSVAGLVSQADGALYEAKRAGRNRVHVRSPNRP